MKTRLAVITSVIVLAAPIARAVLPPENPGLPNFDQRITSAKALAAPAAGSPVANALSKLQNDVPGIRISRDRILETPSFIDATRGFITGPGGVGKGVSADSLASVPAADPHRVVKAFVNQHSALFGYDASALNSARVNRDYVTEHNGLRTTVWQQTVDGIPVFEGLFVAHVTRNDELVSVSTRFAPNPEGAANAAASDRRALAAHPPISAAKAIVNASANLGVAIAEDAVSVQQAPEGPGQRQRLRVPQSALGDSAELVWLPMNNQAMRLCWQVIVRGTSIELYMVLVDAQTGEVLVRRNLTAHATPATYNVFTNDSPSPFSPGWPTPNSTQPTNVTRSLVTITSLSTNASPNGWINDGVSTTRGNNANVFLDRNLDLVPDGPQPNGGPSRTFDFPLDLTTPPTAYSNATQVQLFYFANWYHDRLYQFGFTEAAGNFQVSNFGRGGLGNDEVLGLVDAGADIGFNNNSAFSTPPDGDSGIALMFIFTGPNPDRDGSFDGDVVLHELTHGLSNRLVGGGVGLSALQSGGMGEGWSDFYALCLLSQASDDVNACYAAGGYASYLITPGYVTNYYWGIRRYPYSTDMSKNPLTFKDIDPSAASAHAGVPINPLFGGSDPSEVHNQGEVWCMMLREVWANLVTKWGWQIGNDLTLQLVTDGMKLAPADPTFLEARDAIIKADEIDNTGENASEIWQAFAKRGAGFGASCPGSFSTVGVVESYEVPPDLAPDGILETTINPPANDVFFVNEVRNIFLRVSDGFGITNATIVATLNGQNFTFRNDGVAPDAARNNSVYSGKITAPSTPTNLTLTIAVSATDKQSITNTVNYFVVAVPPNDFFTNAVKITAPGAEFLTSNRRATKESNEPAEGGVSTADASLWWIFTPSVDGPVLVDSGGSGFRSIVAVYTNSTLATLQPVASAVGSASRLGAFVNFNAKAGVGYRIAVAGFDSKSVGALNLLVGQGIQADTNSPIVTIDSPANGTIVTSNVVVLGGTAVDPLPNPSGIQDIRITVSSSVGATTDYTVPLTSLTGPSSTNWLRPIGLAVGDNTIQVTSTDFAGNKSAPSTWHITYRNLVANDFFANAIALTNDIGTNSLNTLAATKEAGEPNHGGNLGGKSVWWTFTPTQDGILTLSTTNSTFDTTMGLYTGSNVAALTSIAQNDDAPDGGRYSKIIQAVKSNITYRVAVDGFDGSGGAMFLTHSFVASPIYHLTVNSTPGGTTSPASAEVYSNQTVSVAATPDANHQFDIWSGDITSLANPLSVVIRGNTTLTANFKSIPYTEDFESGGFQQLNWTFSGNKQWTIQTSSVGGGIYAARSGAINDNKTSSLILSDSFRTGNGLFSFRVSSELNFDQLGFFIDGQLQHQWSGDIAWSTFSFPISDGNHTLEWRYTKDANGSAGLDAAFVDNISLPVRIPTNSQSRATLALHKFSDGTLFIDVAGQTNQQYVIQTSTNLFNWQNVSTNVAFGGSLRVTGIGLGNTGTLYYRAIASP